MGFFSKPFVNPAPDYGTQLLKVGEGGPSGFFGLKAATPISSVYGVAWQNCFNISFAGQTLVFTAPAIVPTVSQSQTGMIAGLMKQPGLGYINQ